MTANPYARMALVRLSPNTGKALTRLNVLQGQVIHGRIYKMEPFSQGADGSMQGTQTGSTGRGGLAKIAIGAHLIEAIVSQPLPEGAHVKLEVIKLGDDSFTLRLLEVDGASVGKSQPAQISNGTDRAVWSSIIQKSIAQIHADSTGSAPAKPESAGVPVRSLPQPFTRIIDLAELPRPAAQVVRSAINQGFIAPADFSVNTAQLRAALLSAITDLDSGVASQMKGLPPQAAELVESINSLVKILRPVINALPVFDVEVSESVVKTISALKESAVTIRSLIPPDRAAAQTDTAASKPANTARQTIQQSQISETASRSQPAAKSTAQQPAPDQSTRPPVDAKPSVPAGQPPASTARPATTPGKLNLSPGQKIPVPEAVKPSTPAEAAAAREQAAVNVRQSVHEAEISARSEQQIHESRSILLGLRVLADLTGRASRLKGLDVEQSVVLSSNTGRLTELSNAFEGTLVAPLLTHAAELPDMVPRLLLNLLFHGGVAEFGILQDGKNPDNQDETPDDDSDTENSGPTVGIIRIKSPGVGELGVRVEYTPTPGEEKTGKVSGQFSTFEDTANEIRRTIKSLDTALEAHGFTGGGFSVITIKEPDEFPPDEPQADKSDNHGLDIKI